MAYITELETLEHNLTLHPAKDTRLLEVTAALRQAGLDLGYLILEHVPSSRERSLALTHLEECLMWANAAIYRNQDDALALIDGPGPG